MNVTMKSVVATTGARAAAPPTWTDQAVSALERVRDQDLEVPTDDASRRVASLDRALQAPLNGLRARCEEEGLPQYSLATRQLLEEARCPPSSMVGTAREVGTNVGLAMAGTSLFAATLSPVPGLAMMGASAAILLVSAGIPEWIARASVTPERADERARAMLGKARADACWEDRRGQARLERVSCEIDAHLNSLTHGEKREYATNVRPLLVAYRSDVRSIKLEKTAISQRADDLKLVPSQTPSVLQPFVAAARAEASKQIVGRMRPQLNLASGGLLLAGAVGAAALASSGMTTVAGAVGACGLAAAALLRPLVARSARTSREADAFVRARALQEVAACNARLSAAEGLLRDTRSRFATALSKMEPKAAAAPPKS